MIKKTLTHALKHRQTRTLHMRKITTENKSVVQGPRAQSQQAGDASLSSRDAFHEVSPISPTSLLSFKIEVTGPSVKALWVKVLAA